MKGRLRWLSHATAALWIIALLSFTTSQAPVEAPLEPTSARVRPVPTEPLPAPPGTPASPPPPPAASEPDPDPPAEAEPARPTRIGASELAEGSSLLDGGGAFPALSFSYEDFPSFQDYARSMQRLGARFVVVRSREIKGQVDIATGVISEASVGLGFSPRARDYSGEPGLATAARAVRERFGNRAVVMMLVPRAIDAGLFGGLSRELERNGETRLGVREIRGRYVRTAAGGIHLRVEDAVRQDGTRIDLEAVFDLGQIWSAGKT